jgi:hypothetical protein
MKIVLYAENCCRAGSPVPNSEIDSYDNSDGDFSDDWRAYEGSPEELIAEAENIERRDPARRKFPSRYDGRRADAIREAVYRQRPDLRPVPEANDDE